MAQMTGLDYKIMEMASRIRDLREILNLTTADMAAKTGVSEEEYIRCENGTSDLNFAFIYRCSLALGVNVTDIIEGHSPTLKSYTLTRRGAGQEINPISVCFIRSLSIRRLLLRQFVQSYLLLLAFLCAFERHLDLSSILHRVPFLRF